MMGISPRDFDFFFYHLWRKSLAEITFLLFAFFMLFVSNFDCCYFGFEGERIMARSDVYGRRVRAGASAGLGKVITTELRGSWMKGR
jgi:hypothetical protein